MMKMLAMSVRRWTGCCVNLLLLIIIATSAVDSSTELQTPHISDQACVPMVAELAPLCANMPYNRTVLPNSFQHRTIQDASREFEVLYPLILTRCSGAIVHLLCSLFFPPCVSEKALQPCRSLCIEVRSSCGNVENWPTYLECNNLPEESCFGPENPSTLTIPDLTGKAAPLSTNRSNRSECKSVAELPICRAIGNYTFSLPNQRGHQLVSEATKELSLFKMFIETKCSRAIAHFLCYYYAPQCSIQTPFTLLPCRELCEFSRHECVRKLQSLNITWPKHMSCDRFPFRNVSVCSGPDDLESLAIPESLLTQPTPSITPSMASSAASVSYQSTITTLTVISSLVLYIL